MQFRVTYAKNDQVLGEVGKDGCTWVNLVHDKDIEYIEFRVGNVVYTLGGFKEYNIKVERVGLALQGISKVFIFARGKNESFVLSVERTSDGIKIDEIKTEVGQEYGGIKVNDWRNGKFDKPYVVKCNLRNNLIKGVYQSE